MYGRIRDWAVSQGQLIGMKFTSIKLVAAADSDGVLITPRVTLRKGWDGRWFNLLFSWGLLTLLLCRLNLNLVQKFRYTACRPTGQRDVPLASLLPLEAHLG
jgi:hypothetical protein